MALYLTDLARWLRDAGLSVIEYGGWQTRARGSGGYSDYPLCVMWHHTASPPSWDGQKDADYCAVGDPDAPLSNLYIDRSGNVWVLAAGATNTNGKGKSITFSRGTVPADSMNTRAVGIEMGNDGVGERWTENQVNAAFVASNTVNARCGNRPDDIATHQFYAPDRKIDPAVDNVAGLWTPDAVTSSGTWSRSDVQAECNRRGAGGVPTPIPPNPPDEDDDDMIFDGLWKRDNHDAIFAIYKNGTKLWVTDDGMLNGMVALQTLNGFPDAGTVRVQNDGGMFAAFGLVIGPRPPGTDEWGNLP